MRKEIKLISKVFSLIFAVILLASVCIAPQTVLAADVSAETQAVLDLIAKLPLDTKTVTIDNKADIIAAKLAYDALTPDQKLEVTSDSVVRLNGNYSAVMPFVLANLVSEIKALPDVEKIGENKKDDIISLYIDYGILDETSKGAFAKKHKEKLLSAVAKLAPDKLTEEDKEIASALTKESEADEQANEDKKVSFSAVWQTSIIIFVSLIVLCALAAMIVLLIKILKLSR